MSVEHPASEVLFSFESRGKTFVHNARKWDVRRNRHPNTDGTEWGWIEGADGNVCWSNGTSFDRHEAQLAVIAHNEWLEAQKPVSLKLIEANEKLQVTEQCFARSEVETERLREELTRARARVIQLKELL